MLDRRPGLCVVAGPNGSGKTSATIQLLSNEWAADALYINPDNIAQETFGDWNSPTAILKAAQVATEERYRCLAEKKDFVFHEVPITKIISRYYKSILNASKAICFVDRAYVYDNSVENQKPRLLYRTTDGMLAKRYCSDMPEWAAEMLPR